MEPLLMNDEPQDMDDGAESQKALTNVKKQSGLERPVKHFLSETIQTNKRE